MFRIWFLLALACLAYALYGFVTGEVVFSSTSRLNGRELKLTGLPAALFSLCLLSTAAAFAGIGCSVSAANAALFERITRIALGVSAVLFLATGAAAILR